MTNKIENIIKVITILFFIIGVIFIALSIATKIENKIYLFIAILASLAMNTLNLIRLKLKQNNTK